MPYCMHSELPLKVYREELRSCIGWKIPFLGDCLNGILIRNFFSVAYYSPYQWNRRITCECNRAIGYLKQTDQGTEVRFVRSKGLFSPLWLVLLMVFFGTIGTVAYGWWKGLTFGAVLTLAVCGSTALTSSITEEGEAGASVITMLLENPKEFYYC